MKESGNKNRERAFIPLNLMPYAYFSHKPIKPTKLNNSSYFHINSHARTAGTTKDENAFGMGVLSLTCIAL